MAIYKSDGVDGQNHLMVKKVVLYATTDITQYDCVMIDTADTTNGLGYSIKAADAADSPLCVGIALEAASAGEYVQVQVAGPMPTATVEGTGASNPAAGELVGCTAADDGGSPRGPKRVKTLAAPSATVAAFALCLDSFGGATTDGVISIIDKGFYE